MRVKFYKIFNKIISCPVPEKLNNKVSSRYKFDSLNKEDLKNDCIKNAEKIVNGNFIYYGKLEYCVGEFPNWFLIIGIKFFLQHQISLEECRDTQKMEMLKNVGNSGDWLNLTRAFILSGNTKYINSLNNLIEDWCNNHTTMQGLIGFVGKKYYKINKCFGFLEIIRKYRKKKISKSSLKRTEFVAFHLRRISKTPYYAKAIIIIG